MKQKLFTLLILAAAAVNAQVSFDEEIFIEDYEITEVLMPPSPLEVTPLFIGGHDIVQTNAIPGIAPDGRAIAKEWHDFIGWTPDSTQDGAGWVSVNHEMIYRNDYIGDGGGMTVFRVETNADGGVDVVEQTLADGRQGEFFSVDFVNTVGETGMNCAGISAPNGRVWTAEEWFRTSNSAISTGNVRGRDENTSLPAAYVVDGERVRDNDGVRDINPFVIDAPEFEALGINGDTIPKYQNFNYMVEIDPREAVAIRKQYNWGRAGWEGGAISADGRYVYLGDDATPAPWVRITASTPWDFVNDVTVEVFKEDNPLDQRWIEIPRTADNIFNDIREEAWEVGATMYVRNEWVTIDYETGIVYWSETGRESTSSGPGRVFAAVRGEYPNVVPSSAHFAWADSLGMAFGPFDPNYQDYYGRVHWYDPSTHETGVVVNGGPFFAESPSISDYPNKHLSNPDGVNMLSVGGEQYLMILEDLNQSDWGSMPAEIDGGSRNRMCEMYILPANARNASVEDLIRITATPFGAEITGGIQITPNVVVCNSQHPSMSNPFPYNHSLTFAITGWEDVTADLLEPTEEDFGDLEIYPNPTTRVVYLSEPKDFAIYDTNGKRVRVFRNTNEADLGGFTPGTYFIQTADRKTYKLMVQ